MFARRCHECGFSVSTGGDADATRTGPFSVKSPISDEQPGPPWSQKINGAASPAAAAAGTYQWNSDRYPAAERFTSM
jgi:hypothetical protein